MSQPPRRWTGGEVLVFSLLLVFGAFASLAFRPFLIVYAVGCVLWLAYWSSTRGK